MSAPSDKALSLFEEFKNFAFKGNVIDLAVGVIIGGALGKIVTSLVDNIIMPVVSLIMPGDSGYKDWALSIGGKTVPYARFSATSSASCCWPWRCSCSSSSSSAG
jgi:large conductance mechanosensitive channel